MLRIHGTNVHGKESVVQPGLYPYTFWFIPVLEPDLPGLNSMRKNPGTNQDYKIPESGLPDLNPRKKKTW